MTSLVRLQLPTPSPTFDFKSSPLIHSKLFPSGSACLTLNVGTCKIPAVGSALTDLHRQPPSSCLQTTVHSGHLSPLTATFLLSSLSSICSFLFLLFNHSSALKLNYCLLACLPQSPQELFSSSSRDHLLQLLLTQPPHECEMFRCTHRARSVTSQCPKSRSLIPSKHVPILSFSASNC